MNGASLIAQRIKDYSSLRIVKIQKVETDTSGVKTFIFRDEACSKASPGQFIMVWIPGVDEIPLSLSMMESKGASAITVKRVGVASTKIHSLKSGDIVGIRGPYGHGFTLMTGDVMLVAGGIGMAPLAPLAKNLAKLSAQITLIMGAATRSELVFPNRIKRELSNIEIIITTEDGSYGWKGLATDPAEERLARQRFNMIYTCGPEKMIQKMFQLAELYNTPIQVSLERIIRCSIGLCGSCVIGKFRVCKDGPVFTSEQLREVKDELGTFKRDFSSKKIKF